MKDEKEKATANYKLITTNSGVRVSQACDRCRIKKIKCDGQYPCHNCSKIGFECKTSDKLTRRAFPKGYTENLEKKLKEVEEENRLLKMKYGVKDESFADGQNNQSILNQNNQTNNQNNQNVSSLQNVNLPNVNLKNEFNHNNDYGQQLVIHGNYSVELTTKKQVQLNNIQINNPIDQIFNVDSKGIIIGNDNLNFESQFNHLLINLNLPFLKITNSHNYLLNDPNSYLYHPAYTNYNQFHNKDMELIYNPLTSNSPGKRDMLTDFSEVDAPPRLPIDVYDLFIKLINNFKKMFATKRELDNQIVQFFLNYNTFIPILDYKQFMESYDAFHTMYPFIFTYDDSTINGFNLLNNNDYLIVNEYLMVIIQIYTIILINDPTINLNLLLNHSDPCFLHNRRVKDDGLTQQPLVSSIYDLLPYFNVFYVSVPQLRTYELFLYYSLLTNNKEKSLILLSLINSFIGILGINLNSKNLFFNDLLLNQQEKRDRVKIFWVFKVLLKCFNLKFGFKPSINTTVINPVTIDRYFQLTPEKLSALLDPTEGADDLFSTLLKPSVEFLNLMNIVIPSSFAPNYYEYLKQGRQKKGKQNHTEKDHREHKALDWLLNEDDGEGNDGNLNYNFNQFLTIDKNLSNWRQSLKTKHIDLTPLQTKMGLPNLLNITSNDLYHDLKYHESKMLSGITHEGLLNYYSTGLPDVHTASQLIKIQLNFHYIVIRSMNYLNFIVDKELNFPHYVEISKISREVLNYFLLIFNHVNHAKEVFIKPESTRVNANNIVMESLGLDVDEDGFVINDFSVKRRRSTTHPSHKRIKRITKEIPPSPFNFMLNGLSLTVINLKKSIVLQMVFLLICQLKFVKRKEFGLINDSPQILERSISLFEKIFINYKTDVVKPDSKEKKEDELFKKLVNDHLKEDILRDHDESDDEDDFARGSSASYKNIDWDDEEMDEDLKYLKILKFIKYKSGNLANQAAKQIPEPAEVHHHHHHHSVGPQQDLPPPATNAQMRPYYSGSPENFPNRFPSLTKMDYFGGDYNKHGSPNGETVQDDELIKKEKLVINDLMNLRHQIPGLTIPVADRGPEPNSYK